MPQLHKTLLITLALLCCAYIAKSDNAMIEMPLHNGQPIDPNSKFAKDWPGANALFKIKALCEIAWVIEI
jgi:hypothetical protein